MSYEHKLHPSIIDDRPEAFKRMSEEELLRLHAPIFSNIKDWNPHPQTRSFSDEEAALANRIGIPTATKPEHA